MAGLERQIGQLSDEIVSLASLPDASSFSGPRAIEEFAHSLRAEILRLKSELDTCEHDLQQHRVKAMQQQEKGQSPDCLLYTSPSPRDRQKSRMPSSA